MLGTYDIDENGDTTLTDYGLYAIEGGEPTFDKVIKAAGLGASTSDGLGGGPAPVPPLRIRLRTRRWKQHR